MKYKLTKDRGAVKAGSVVEVTAIEAAEIIQNDGGYPLEAAEKIESQQNRLAQLEASEKKRKEAFRDHKINAAINRGAIAAKDSATIKVWEERLMGAEPDAMAAWLDSLPGKSDLTQRTTPTQASEAPLQGSEQDQHRSRIERPYGGQVDPQESIKAYAKAMKDSNALYARDVRGGGGPQADALRRRAGAIAAMELFSILDKRDGDFCIRASENDPIMAANSLGTLSGTLVLQRTLQLLKRKLLMLTRISTDFSAEGAKINQVIDTRYRAVPSVTTYNTTTGWSNSDATTTSATVTIGAPQGVQIAFDTQTLGSTVRNLFAEQSEPIMYALSNALVEAWVAVLTSANFNHTADVPDSNGPATAWGTVGVNIGAAASQTAGSGRAQLVAAKNGLDVFLNPDFQRLILLNTAYYNGMILDPELSLYINVGNAQVLADGQLPVRYGFMIEMSQALNELSSPIVGFAQTPSATLIAARLPQDYTQVFPDLPPTAVVEAVTEPETGLSLQMCRFVDHQLANARMRAAVAFGANIGQKNAGMLLTSS